MKYVDATSSFDWLQNAKFNIAKATRWSITPSMLEEQDMTYLFYLLECLDIDSFIEEKWQKEHERQSKVSKRGGF